MADVQLVPAPAEQTHAGRLSPAAHLSEAFAWAEVTGARAVRISETPFLSMVGLRVRPGSAAAERVETALGVALPARCGSVSTGESCSVLWLSPDEFLIVSADGPAHLTRAAVEALEGEPGSAVDLSANRTTFALAGPKAREVLEKGCALDLHPREFAVGAAYVTLLGPVPVILWRVEEELYRILPRSSYADFLGRWLIDAMAEFKVPEID
jgi:sarcosine oxidase subunit gamma